MTGYMGSSTSFLLIDGELIYIQMRGGKRCNYCTARCVFRVRTFAGCRLSPATLLFLYCALLAHVRCKGFIVILFYITLRYIMSPTEDKSGGGEEGGREKREKDRERESEGQRQRGRDGERERERQRDRDRQTDRERGTDGERESAFLRRGRRLVPYVRLVQ